VIGEAIVLAGGLGTRLQQVVSDVPKSMALISGRPFIEYLFDYLSAEHIRSVILAVGYKSDVIRRHFGTRYRSLEIRYACEDEPLGTGGGIRNAFQMVEGEEAFVLNGDSLFRISLAEMHAFHCEGEGMATLALRYLGNISRYGSVEIDHLHRIKGFTEKREDAGPGYINGGIYILNKKFLTGELFTEKFSIEKDCFERYYRDFMMLGFAAEGYFLDIGIPEDYERAQDEFKRLEY
jgi:D-glycero-alpha-D-manno-heptose 1-phosphate guanylyltransferase